MSEEGGAALPLFFHALATFSCKANRLYRVYLLPQEWVFVWAGKGGEGAAGALATARSSASGRGLGAVLARMLDPTEQNLARLEKLDSTPFEAQIADHPLNLRLPVAGFTEARFCPRSDAHARLFSDHHHQARLFLRHRAVGKYRLGLQTVEETRLAMREVPRRLGALGVVVRLELAPPEREQPCGCVFCRRIREGA